MSFTAAALAFEALLVLLVLVLVAGVGLIVWVNVRARRLDRQVGSFRSWSRPDTQAGWTSGIGMYGTETLTWYRLVGFTMHPEYVLPRRGLEVSAPSQRAVDGSLVEVRLTNGDLRVELAVTPGTYNGLVSWVESGPPRHRG